MAKDKYAIEFDDTHRPTYLTIQSKYTKMDMVMDDEENSGGRITLFNLRNKKNEQITLYMPEAAIAAVKELFRKS